MALPSPPPTWPPPDVPSSASLLVAAAARVEARRVTYGPLWGVRCSTGNRPKTELLVYDVFCMIFLDRPGAYYRIDQVARTTRGRFTPAFLIAQLQAYHRLLLDAHGDRAKPFLTNLEAKDWWLMPQRVRRSLPFPPSYDFHYPAFLRKFLPQLRNQDVEFRFFNSLTHYLPLLLSPDVELRRCPLLSDSAFSYGIFARRQLEDGEYRRPVPALRGQLVAITEKEKKALEDGGADFNVLVLDGEEFSRLEMPGEESMKRRRVNKGGGTFVIAGGMTFLTAACEDHANVWPAVWGDDGDVGMGQWQVATTKWSVRAGEQLCHLEGGGARVCTPAINVRILDHTAHRHIIPTSHRHHTLCATGTSTLSFSCTAVSAPWRPGTSRMRAARGHPFFLLRCCSLCLGYADLFQQSCALSRTDFESVSITLTAPLISQPQKNARHFVGRHKIRQESLGIASKEVKVISIDLHLQNAALGTASTC